ncbi:BTAD domain-containing putative transcriptional regulator [Cellulomonas humilata]|uniref:DNA-binding SARP family transcriptional activator n=1 Tax=Cellulomonas humilata TaxID=144055 RepID=A0ABU0EEP6_9CELL|nr:BTAD domain-containing putative transcriptional regulator [Cellulomonas humilata]MDQ0373740.1 DNA-binding SARP family transcriptional activator [Cellulomonas humilata]
MSGAEGHPAVLRARTRRPAPRGLSRDRLLDPVVGPGAQPLVSVVAAAGCGKTTFLSHVAARETAPVAWLTLDGALGSTAAVLAHLQLACADLAPAVAELEPWTTTEDALVALEKVLEAPALLVLDELQSIDGSAAAGVVEGLLLHQPVHLRVALGSRTVTSTALTRHLAGTATVLGAEDLRFRTWEVEELFRTCHGTRLRADEVADLAHRTGGWAAGLELFHLATHGRPPSSRARLLGVGGGQLSGDYLARHVLDQVPAPLRDFLVRTAVLATLTAARCDELLGSTDSAALLEQAHRLGLLNAVADAECTVYGCHEVMRAHLLDVLVGRDGGARARELHQRSAQLALREGDFDAALRSSCRAHDWDAAQRVLAIGGGELAERPGSWIDELPPSIRDTDPWVALALARRLVVDGALEEALEAYRLAGTRVETATGRALAAHELRMVQSWVNPPLGVVSDWVALTRDAFVAPRRQLAEARPTDAPRRLAHAVAQLTSGDLTAAAREFSAVSELPTLPSALEAVALLGEAASLSLSFRPEAAESRERAAVAAKMLGAPALERIADGLDLACRPDTAREALCHLRDRCAAIGDRWGAALLGLFGAVAGLPSGMLTADEHSGLASELTALGAPALATWCTTMAAVEDARAGRVDPGATADVERVAAGVGPLPHTIALLASGTAQGRVRAARLARSSGAATWATLVLRGMRPTRASVEAEAPPALEVRCIGGFTVLRDGTPVALNVLRPQHQALLRALALHAPLPVHRERLVEWFWEGRDPERAQHSLQVAISALRGLLDRATATPATSVVRRTGGGYALHLGAADLHDVRRVERHLAAGRSALERGDVENGRRSFAAGVRELTADLLPDDGPAEWVTGERDEVRGSVVRACQSLADLCAAAGDGPEAIQVTRHALALDRYQDGLWTRLIDALAADGQPAAAATARREYAQVLAELDVPITVPGTAALSPVLAGPLPVRVQV